MALDRVRVAVGALLPSSGVGRDKKVDTKDKGMVGSKDRDRKKGTELRTDQTDRRSRESIMLLWILIYRVTG